MMRPSWVLLSVHDSFGLQAPMLGDEIVAVPFERSGSSLGFEGLNDGFGPTERTDAIFLSSELLMCVAFVPLGRSAEIVSSLGLPLDPLDPEEPEEPEEPDEPEDPLDPDDPLEPEDPPLDFGQSASMLPAFAIASHDFDSRHVSCDCVTEPAQRFAHPCCATSLGAPHALSFEPHALVQSLVDTVGSVVPPPLVPPDEPSGPAPVVPEHATTAEKKKEKRPEAMMVRRIFKVPATCMPKSHTKDVALFLTFCDSGQRPEPVHGNDLIQSFQPMSKTAALLSAWW
jgi:hypothetical protein